MARGLASRAWPDGLRFARRFLRHPGRVGSIVPSSRRLASGVLAGIERPPGGARPLTIVELGAGTGAFTRAIVAGLREGDRFISIEVDAAFVDILRRRWPDIDIVCASAEALCEIIGERALGAADHIVSGLPFATLPGDTTRRIVSAVARSLRDGGTFSTFHYLHSYGVPSATTFRRLMTSALGSTPSVEFVARNLPPALAVTWTKQRSLNGPGPYTEWQDVRR